MFRPYKLPVWHHCSYHNTHLYGPWQYELPQLPSSHSSFPQPHEDWKHNMFFLSSKFTSLKKYCLLAIEFFSLPGEEPDHDVTVSGGRTGSNVLVNITTSSWDRTVTYTTIPGFKLCKQSIEQVTKISVVLVMKRILDITSGR